MSKGRELDFRSLDEIMLEVESLLRGHVTTGRWTLAQILHHLATSIRATALGRKGPDPQGVSEELRRQFFTSRRFPEGLEAPHPRLVPPVDCDLLSETRTLRDALARFMKAAGPFPSHPFLGPLDKAGWEQFHCIHCAHHLGFASPTRTAAEPSSG